MKTYIIKLALLFTTTVFFHTVNAQTTINLNSHFTGTAPSGTVLEWHSALPLSSGNALTAAQAGAATAGTYYAVFYDAANNCYSPETKVKVLNNACPVTTVDLTLYSTSVPPPGTTLEWHTNSAPSAGNLVMNPNAVGAGTYFAVFRDSVNNCYSPVSSPVVVFSTACDVFCYRPAITTGVAESTKYGITALQRAGAGSQNWPGVRNGAWAAIEAKTKGFVLNRLTTDQKNALVAVEGMIVYDKDLDCLSIYDSTGWKCYSKQSCPN